LQIFSKWLIVTVFISATYLHVVVILIFRRFVGNKYHHCYSLVL